MTNPDNEKDQLKRLQSVLGYTENIRQFSLNNPVYLKYFNECVRKQHPASNVVQQLVQQYEQISQHIPSPNTPHKKRY